MSASTGVQWVLDYIASHDWDGDARPGNAAVDSVVAAIAELIAADSEYDRARAAWLADHSKHNEFVAAREAWNRRAAALARVKGEVA